MRPSACGSYLTVGPPRRVVFSWGISGNDTLPAGGSTVEVELTPDGDDTVVVLTHRGLSAAHIGYHRTGWADRLGRLRVTTGEGRRPRGGG